MVCSKLVTHVTTFLSQLRIVKCSRSSLSTTPDFKLYSSLWSTSLIILQIQDSECCFNMSSLSSCRCIRAAVLVKYPGSLVSEEEDSDMGDDEDRLDDENDGSFDDENIQYDPTGDAIEGGAKEQYGSGEEGDQMQGGDRQERGSASGSQRVPQG